MGFENFKKSFNNALLQQEFQNITGVNYKDNLSAYISFIGCLNDDLLAGMIENAYSKVKNEMGEIKKAVQFPKKQ